MEKGLIGNSLSYCMRDILSGKVSPEDVAKIYTGTYFQEETIDKDLKSYDMYWEEIAYERAKKEIINERGVEDNDAIKKRTAEILPAVEKEARNLWDSLSKEGKIVQVRYILPEGEKELATYISRGETITDRQYEIEGKTDPNNGYPMDQGLMKINGIVYKTGSEYTGVYTDPEKRWCANEIEFIASQLGQTMSVGTDVYYMKAAMLKLLFPQYEQEITQLCDDMRSSYLDKEKPKFTFKFDERLSMLEELIRTKNAHTAESIEEGITDVTQSEVNAALTDMTSLETPKELNK